MTSPIGRPDAADHAEAHVLDIELTTPVAGLQRTAPNDRPADRAWALTRSFGEMTASDTASVLARPSMTVDLVRLEPLALRGSWSSDNLRAATLEYDFPRDLLAQNHPELIAGPWFYLRGWVQSGPGAGRSW